MKVELLNLSFSKEDALKIVSKIKKKFLAYNISGITLHKFRSKFRIHKHCTQETMRVAANYPIYCSLLMNNI